MIPHSILTFHWDSGIRLKIHLASNLSSIQLENPDTYVFEVITHVPQGLAMNHKIIPVLHLDIMSMNW